MGTVGADMVDPEIPKKIWREIFAEKNQQKGHVEGHQQKDMDVSKNRGTPKWMVYNEKPY